MPVSVRAALKRIQAINLLAVSLKERSRYARLNPLPSVIAVELTNICNLCCEKCPLEQTSRKRGIIDDALFEKILCDIRHAETSTELALSGSGEPTMHPRLVEYVRKAREISNIGVIGFASNGIKLTPDLSGELLDAGLTRLKASLDTDNADSYLKHNKVDAYNQVVENFRRFCEINKQTGNRCKVTLKATLYEEDLALGRRLTEQWAPYVDRVRITPVHNWGGSRGPNTSPPRTDACHILWEHVQILWDGQITLCCMDNMEGRFDMGNIADISMTDYWLRDKGLQQVRHQHSRGDLSKLPVCAECDINEYADVNPELLKSTPVAIL